MRLGWKRRYIKQWHEGTLRIYKKRGRIRWDSSPEIEVAIDAGTIQCFHCDNPDKPLTEEERKKFSEKPKFVEGEGKLVSFEEFVRERGKSDDT